MYGFVFFKVIEYYDYEIKFFFKIQNVLGDFTFFMIEKLKQDFTVNINARQFRAMP
jgi:hypothetical protein